MNQAEGLREVRLSIPAEKSYGIVASLALSGLGMVAGLDVDLLGDLRTVTMECLDCLMNQPGHPAVIEMAARLEADRLFVAFCARERERTRQCDELALDITRGVLETLMPQVHLDVDEDGVHGIECSMPV